MKSFSRFFLLVVLLTLSLHLSSYFMATSGPGHAPKEEWQSCESCDENQILEVVYSNPVRFLFLQIFVLALICGVFSGLALDIAFVSRVLRNKTLGFDKDFSRANPAFDEVLRAVILIVFFFFAFKFIQHMLADIFRLRKFTLALVINGLFEAFSILAITAIVGSGRFPYRLSLWGTAKAAFRQYAGMLPALMAVLFITLFTFKYFELKPEPMPAVSLLIKEKSILNLVMLFAEGVILAPIFEELFFRGLVYGFLRKRCSVGFSCLVSGVFFSLLHTNAFAFLPILVLGIGLACLYERTKTILAPMLLHSFHNLSVLILLFIVKPYY